MPKPFTPGELATLEIMIDTYSLPVVVEALSQIAYEKADHILTQWQDAQLASTWRKTSRTLQTVAAELPA